MQIWCAATATDSSTSAKIVQGPSRIHYKMTQVDSLDYELLRRKAAAGFVRPHCVTLTQEDQLIPASHRLASAVVAPSRSSSGWMDGHQLSTEGQFF